MFRRLALLAGSSGKTFLVGFGTEAATGSLWAGVRIARGKFSDDAPRVDARTEFRDVLKNAVFTGSLMAVSTNLRMQVATHIEQNITRVIKNEPASRMILSRVNLGNSALGSWSSAKIAVATGMSGAKGATRIEGEDLGWALLHTENDDSEAGYLLDFLN